MLLRCNVFKYLYLNILYLNLYLHYSYKWEVEICNSIYENISILFVKKQHRKPEVVSDCNFNSETLSTGQVALEAEMSKTSDEDER